MFTRSIVVVGTGCVGLTTGACLASLGHHVVCADIDTAKIDQLIAGNVRISEPGLAELVGEGMAAGRLAFVVGAGAALAELADRGTPAEVVFLCVPTDRTTELLGRTDVAVVSNPEFLREGSAVRDFLHPDRIVVGGNGPPDAAVRGAALYARLSAPRPCSPTRPAPR